jgi:hypothetical protein
MSKYYKPNNSIILYLNNSFYCIKSNSITLTKATSISGYTSILTVFVVPAAGDLGYGATRTLGANVSGALGTFTLGNTKGYSALPTVTLRGGGDPGKINAITITNAGSGYNVGRTLTFTGGAGTGADGYVSSVNGSRAITGIVITNQGKNYTSAPSIGFGTGTDSSAVLTPVLNHGTGGTFTVAFIKTFTYTWSIPEIMINDLGRLSVVNINASGYTAATPYTFRVINLQYDSKNSFFSDYGNPILSIAQQTNMSSYGNFSSNSYKIVLTPQALRQIQICVDDSITAKEAGTAAAVNFVIAIEIEEFDVSYTRVDDPYSEAAANIKGFEHIENGIHWK